MHPVAGWKAGFNPCGFTVTICGFWLKPVQYAADDWVLVVGCWWLGADDWVLMTGC